MPPDGEFPPDGEVFPPDDGGVDCGFEVGFSVGVADTSGAFVESGLSVDSSSSSSIVSSASL